MNKVRTQVMLTPEEYKLLRYLSGEKRVSIAALIRRAVDSFYSKETDINERKDKALKHLFSLMGVSPSLQLSLHK